MCFCRRGIRRSYLPTFLRCIAATGGRWGRDIECCMLAEMHDCTQVRTSCLLVCVSAHSVALMTYAGMDECFIQCKQGSKVRFDFGALHTSSTTQAGHAQPHLVARIPDIQHRRA
ncbi:hypothetical protein K466DRAFT_668610 [Polyporus arcularius HHB13444]|uniref:Uncharacterized protein n=1 Tax=Polyporus arcularius HHB13444 TaxID=1314778 RepID=A0A5C3NK07_9APHY|nr:hypothetical protein K466DRAFT_668610 [Polyporus arcularius HHB13444]